MSKVELLRELKVARARITDSVSEAVREIETSEETRGVKLITSHFGFSVGLTIFGNKYQGLSFIDFTKDTSEEGYEYEVTDSSDTLEKFMTARLREQDFLIWEFLEADDELDCIEGDWSIERMTTKELEEELARGDINLKETDHWVFIQSLFTAKSSEQGPNLGYALGRVKHSGIKAVWSDPRELVEEGPDNEALYRLSAKALVTGLSPEQAVKRVNNVLKELEWLEHAWVDYKELTEESY